MLNPAAGPRWLMLPLLIQFGNTQITTQPRRKDRLHKELCEDKDLIPIQHAGVRRFSNASPAGREINTT